MPFHAFRKYITVQYNAIQYIKQEDIREFVNELTLNLLTTTIVAPPSNASKW